jgi:hypothetical protein
LIDGDVFAQDRRAGKFALAGSGVPVLHALNADFPQYGADI